MFSKNRIEPTQSVFNTLEFANGDLSPASRSSSKEVNDLDSLSTVGLEESSYLKLRPFNKLDPTLARLLTFFNCFGLTVNFVNPRKNGKDGKNYSMYAKILVMLVVGMISGEVVYDVNIRQSKLLAEQKRSTPLLTFVIVAYSWLTLLIPIFCDLSLILIGPHLFRFYSRTTATVCNGMFFGKRTSVDSWVYYLILVLIAFLDAVGQVVVLGVWPKSVDPYLRIFYSQDGSVSSSAIMINTANVSGQSLWRTTEITPPTELLTNEESELPIDGPRIRAHLLDFLLGESYAHGDLGVCIKIICLMIQFFHSYAYFLIIISLANHYAAAINNINENLHKYEFCRLLKQLIILRDSSEQISLITSAPLALIIILVFMRQIALNGVFIQSTMLNFENWAISLQALTSTLSIIMVFIYCDGLQSSSKQTHRLKTEQTVINENRGGNQSIYEFLDYLDRLSKSIRITFFNIIAINKSSLVGLFGHILTLTFVTS